MWLVTTRITNRVFASGRSQGTKENTACQEVRLSSKRITEVGVESPRVGNWGDLTSLNRICSIFNFLPWAWACLVLSLASTRGILAYLFQSLRLFTLGCLACGFSLLSFFVMVVLSLQLIRYSTGTLRFDPSLRSQRIHSQFPTFQTHWVVWERRELLAHGVWIVCISNWKPRQPSAQGFLLISWVFWQSNKQMALMREAWMMPQELVQLAGAGCSNGGETINEGVILSPSLLFPGATLGLIKVLFMVPGGKCLL